MPDLPEIASMQPVGRDRVGALRPALFLDRDGVVNVDTGYAHRAEDLVLTPTAARGIRRANEAECLVVVVTNQSGVARGLFGLDDIDRFHRAIDDRLRGAGARIDAYYCCPYHPDGTVAAFSMVHEDRKPAPGMLLRAMRDRPIDAARSLMVGDRRSDMEAAAAAGVAAVLVPRDDCDLDAVVAEWLAGADERLSA